MTDYTAILYKLKEILDEIENTFVFVEIPRQGDTPGAEVGIFMDSEENEEHTIGSDNPYLTHLNIEIVCQDFSPDGVGEACRKRDALVGKVRDLLKVNRDIGGLVGSSQIGRITFETAQGAAGFYSAASIPLRGILFS